MPSAPSPAAVRPVVLALAPPAPGISRGTATPSLERLGGSRLIERLLGTLRDVGLPAPRVVAVPEATAQLRAALGPGIAVLAVEGDRRAALRAVLETSGPGPLLLHDAERALTPPAVIAEALAALDPGADAVVPVVAMTDSVKEVRREGLRNVDRTTLAALQSPRLLRRELLEQVVEAPAAGGDAAAFDEIRAALDTSARVRTVHGSQAGFAVLDRLSLWRAQIALGLARDTSHRHGLARHS